MDPITVYSPQTSSRLVYILDWIFSEVFQCTYVITSQESDLEHVPFFISYGKAFNNALLIPDAGLLWEKKISAHPIVTGIWQDIPTLYHQNSESTIPFDIFSAVFFLLSRYEEYFDYVPDKHGRYPVHESILHRNSWLDRPLVDEWLFQLYSLLRERVASPSLKPFSFQPTYDIDIAFSFKHKGFVRTAGAIVKAAINNDVKAINERLNVAQGHKSDPFDCFQWLRDLHKTASIEPVYFILAALKTTTFDKNISPLNPEMARLIQGFKEEGVVGLHPSYYSTDQEVFKGEKEVLEKITGNLILWSRQHYIRLKLPDTYYHLLEEGITDDWSMGYGASVGFRAGTGRPFFWYDLKRETITTLRIHTFCFMDSTAHYEEKLQVDPAFETLSRMTAVLERTQSTLVTVFHNFSLGTDPEWTGWNERYANFITNSCKK